MNFLTFLVFLEGGKANKIATEFTEDARKLLSRTLELPEYVLLLIDLYGMRTLKDLSTFGDGDINEIITMVREGLFERIDLKSPSTRKQYLGHDYSDVKTFKFKTASFRRTFMCVLRLMGT